MPTAVHQHTANNLHPTFPPAVSPPPLPESDTVCWSEGFALTGYVDPGCVEDGAWMLWGSSSIVAVAPVLARHFFDNF